MLVDPRLGVGFGFKHADPGRMTAGYSDLDTERPVVKRDDAVGCLGVRVCLWHFMQRDIDLGCSKPRPTRSCPQVNRELVFRSAGGAGRRIDNHALGRPHARSDDQPAITAEIICIAGAPKQRFVRSGRRGSGGTRWRARDLEGDGRHRFALLMIL